MPGLFAVNALAVAAQTQLGRDPRAALALAERLVARAPIEPGSTALLGASRAAIGDEAGADRAFRVAGRLGWRVPLTQSYLLGAALDARDFAVAAQRLDALLRLQPLLLRDPELLAPFEDDPAGKAALINQLVTRPPWLSWYAGAVDPTPTPILAHRVPTLLMLNKHGVVLGCATVAPALRQLWSAGLTAQADALRRAHCPNDDRRP